MAQHAWNITGHYGKTYKLGLFHGEKTHHVVVHCNNSIVAIDFGVKESKTYTLFLDQQLCEVSIDPHNLQRRKQREEEKRSERIRLFAAGAVLLIIVAFLMG